MDDVADVFAMPEYSNITKAGTPPSHLKASQELLA